ncbi:hypothetical protein BD560DRAFT_430256 [Blakeslea trispora]|nr:hypothetical protein BD560DRAFT_430256 [Blakeslea trispora]
MPRDDIKGRFSIVTPFLWEYLVKTYGLVGNTPSSEDVTGPEYCGLIDSIRDWRLN